MAKASTFTIATEDDVRTVFAGIARVKDVRLIKDRISGAQKPFAFIEFATAEEADSAVYCGEQGCVKLLGETVTVLHSKGKRREVDAPTPVVSTPLFTVPSKVNAVTGEYRVPAHYKWDSEKGMYYDQVADGYWDQRTNLFYL